MDMDKLVSLVPLVVAVIGGMFVLIASTTAKEKEIKLIKFESLGLATYSLLEKLGIYTSRLYSEIYNIVRDGNSISIATVQRITRDIKESHPDIALCRELSVKLTYADKKSSLIFNKHLKEFSSLYNQAVNLTHATNIENYKYKHEHTNTEAIDIAKKLKFFSEQTNYKKSYITNRLSKKYNSTLNYSRNLTYKFLISFTIFLLACFYFTPHQENIPNTLIKENIVKPAPAPAPAR